MSNLILIIGGTGQGKSYYTNKNILNNEVRKVNNKDVYFPTSQSKRQYVFDINNEYSLPDDNIIKPIMRNARCDDKQFISNCKRITNTNIVFEDASGFLRGKQSKEMARLMVGRRHTGNNFIILFHSINRVPPELMEYCNYLILFKTGDNLKDVDTKFKTPLINQMFLTLQSKKEHSHLIKKLL